MDRVAPVMKRPCARHLAAATLTAALVGAGCGSPAPPPTLGYTIDFQSTDAAVTVDTLDIDIFDATKNDCVNLLLERRSGQRPLPVAKVEGVGVCEVLDGKRGPVVGSNQDASILIVARKGTSDYLIGCGVRRAGSTEGPVITLTNFSSSVTIHPSACVSVRARCDLKC